MEKVIKPGCTPTPAEAAEAAVRCLSDAISVAVPVGEYYWTINVCHDYPEVRRLRNLGMWSDRTRMVMGNVFCSSEQVLMVASAVQDAWARQNDGEKSLRAFYRNLLQRARAYKSLCR